MKFIVVFALAIGLCAWTGDVRAQGSTETDRAAPEAVYRATGGGDWADNGNWLSAAPLGDWYRVETNEQGLLRVADGDSGAELRARAGTD